MPMVERSQAGRQRPRVASSQGQSLFGTPGKSKMVAPFFLIHQTVCLSQQIFNAEGFHCVVAPEDSNTQMKVASRRLSFH